jgi:hypothetical protein
MMEALYTRLHGSTSQKTAIFILVVLRTWNLVTPFNDVKQAWEIRFGDVDWINLAQDRNRWQALVNTVMNLRVP